MGHWQVPEEDAKEGAAGRGKRGIPEEQLRQVIDGGGKLKLSELLSCRVRYFGDGVAIGSRGLVEGVFTEFRDHLGEKRKDGARALRVGAVEQDR